MYKVLIADDEDIIRKGLSCAVPWNDWGYEVAGLAENGIAAMALLDEVRPDVMLTDVRMPKLDGLELAKFINENHSGIKVVILSGYNETDYLQEAIRNKVVAYLNKPTDYNEFEREFRKLKIALDKERTAEKENARLREYLEESLPHMREFFFFNCLSGRIEDLESIGDKVDFYNISIPQPEFVVVLIEIDNYYRIYKTQPQEKVYLLMKTVVYLAEHIFVNKSFFYDNNTNSVVGLCSCADINKKIVRLQAEFLALEGLTISVSVSSRAHSARDVTSKWDEAAQALGQKAFLGDGAVIFYDDISDFRALSAPDIRREINRIIDTILHKDANGLEREVLKLFAKFENEAAMNYEYIDKICLEVLFAAERAVGTSKLTLNGFLEARAKSMFDVFKFDSIYAKKDWLLDVITGFAKSAADETQNKMNSIAREAFNYIEENYMNNTLSLDSAADYVGKNPAYLSTLFKNETGWNFSEYVRDLRIEKGKELLLSSNRKIYEIAEMVGYADVSNFIRVFKRHTGISPGEYRNGR